uniref:NADH-ubiquinone oxidoreductase chain 2 n=1 Tax=Glena unipennaria TaxID=1981046 RepID=A0A343YVH9_9NEOP|nr:NADH dehydrogenase subunit 2 [Glena unipennaria]
MTISSYSWFSMWMGLEINLLSITPLLTTSKDKFSSEATLKYFMTQVLASMILLFSIMMILNFDEQTPNNQNLFFMLPMYTSIFIKMGAAPFHFWFPEVMEGLSWNNCLIMMTWQKIAPMIILINNLNLSTMIIIIVIISSSISSILGLNQISMRKILAYSSINHIAWMITSMLSMKLIWLIYFCIYSITL